MSKYYIPLIVYEPEEGMNASEYFVFNRLNKYQTILFTNDKCKDDFIDYVQKVIDERNTRFHQFKKFSLNISDTGTYTTLSICQPQRMGREILTEVVFTVGINTIYQEMDHFIEK